jgi:hypothetical protein
VGDTNHTAIVASNLRMTKSETKLLVGIGVLILLIDIFLMKYWVSNIKPDPFMSVGIKFHRLQIFGVNILIGIFVFFIKKRFSILFFVNTIVCYLIFSFFWNSWLENYPFSYSEFSFTNNNRNFIVHIEKNPDGVSLREIKKNSKDSILTLYYGEYEKIGDSLKLSLRFLNNDQYKIEKDSLIMRNRVMYIFENNLIGFPESPIEIKLTEKE